MGEEDRPGALLAGRYRLERIVGRGASAAVWEATHVVTSQTVALKVFGGDAGLGADGTGGRGKRRDRLLREARAASRSRHPHVLAIDDLLDLEDGRAALVMPLLTGQSLRDRLAQDGKLSPDLVRALFGPALDGLARAHDAGVVHRDLKPDNLFVAADPTRLVILDFGVAKIAADGDLGLTSTGVTVGTPFYMAPEQLFGEDDVDARADIWAVGVVLFECLKGERPTEAGNLGQLLKRVSAGKVARLEPEDVPHAPALVAIVNAMLSVEREARPTLAEVRAALDAPPASSNVVAAGPSVPPISQATVSPAQSAPSEARSRSRGRPLLLGGLLAAALASTVAALVRTSGPSAEPPTRPLPPSTPPVASATASVALPEPAASIVPTAPGPEPSAATRTAPSAGSPPARVVGTGPIPSSGQASASAKIVAVPPPSAVSSPLPPRIVEQAPF